MMFLAGTTSKHIMLLLNEADIINENFLEDVNNLINNGEISGLIGREYQDRINAVLQDEARFLKKEALSLFNSRMRNKLHIIMCLSPVGDILRQRFRKFIFINRFPALVSCCNINWVLPWPKDALY